jgi:hypothetical protein
VNLNPDRTVDPDVLARRMLRFIVILAAIGTGFAGLYGGWSWAAGFLIGAAASWWNFRNLTRVVAGLGSPASTGTLGAFAWLLFRFIALALGAFVIIRFTQINLKAAFAGLFIPVGAVILETIFELTYAR